MAAGRPKSRGWAMRGARHWAMLAIAMVVPFAGCSSNIISTPLPLTAENVQGYVLDAMQRDGQITLVRTWGRTPDGAYSQEPSVTWLDLAGGWGQSETTLAASDDSGPGRLKWMAGPTLHASSVMSSGEAVRMTEVRDPDRWAPLESHLDRLAGLEGLVPLIPLGPALAWGQQWEALGAGEWEAQESSSWRVEYENPLYGRDAHTSATIHLDPSTALPVGLRSATSGPLFGEDMELTRFSRYTFEFIDEAASQPGLFDVESLRDQVIGTVTSDGAPLEALWFGTAIDLGSRLPPSTLEETLAAADSALIRYKSEPPGVFVRFSYGFRTREAYSERGAVSVTTWPREVWEREVDLPGPANWWGDASVRREPLEISEVVGEFAVAVRDGYAAPSPRLDHEEGQPVTTFREVRQATEALVWLDGSVTLISAPFLNPLHHSPSPGDPPVRMPGFQGEGDDEIYVADLNRFGGEDAVRELVRLLEARRRS